MNKLTDIEMSKLDDDDLLNYIEYHMDDYFGDTDDKDDKDDIDCTCDVDKIKSTTASTLVCPKCGVVSDIPVYINSYSVFERCTFRKKCIYKRGGNFTVILKQFICMQDQVVPDDVIKTLWSQINNTDNLVYNYVIPLSIPILESLLKKNKLMSYKNSIFYIYFTLMNQPFPHLTIEERNRAQHLFTVISRLYNKYKPNKKKSFINYYFTLKKIFQALGMNDYAKIIPQLKTQSRQKEIERIWGLISKDSKWAEALQKQMIS